ncbi:alcohol dehydrogenase protein [Rutstroemia sp. NJR-2017a BBW]|nr:alcohol dehydrogenase protein [Rutstroemia sp. NJR-2017a BBW]
MNAQAVLAYTTFGEPFEKFGKSFPAMKEVFEYGKMFWGLNEELVGRGKVRPHPVEVREGGLGGVPTG